MEVVGIVILVLIISAVLFTVFDYPKDNDDEDDNDGPSGAGMRLAA